MLKNVVLTLSTILALAACGSDDKPTLRESCDRISTAQCFKATQCSPDPGSANFDACMAQQMKVCCETAGTCEATHAASPEAVDRCVNTITSMQCEYYVLVPPACWGL